MYKIDIGILFDVSFSMKEPYNSFNFKYSQSKADEIINILNRIASRGKNSKNEQIRIFSILFGGCRELIYDFCSLIEIANQTFNHDLKSNDYDKAKEYKEYGFGKKLEEILSEHGNKTLYLSKYLYCDSGPTEKLCEMGYYLLRDDQYLRERIYNKLPYECKSTISNGGVNIVTFFGFYKKDINNSTERVINDIYDICISEYANKIIEKEKIQRKSNGNQLRFINGNDLINIKNNLEKKLVSPKNKSFNLIDLFEKFIYGNTPLYTALNMSFDNFKKQSDYNNNKFLFIISDGELNDITKNFDYIGEIRKKAEENKITIISIFLTSKQIPKDRTFYDEVQSHFTNGSKDLFLMSSTLNYENPVIKFFIKKEWNIPTSGECKLFIEINNSQNLNEFIDIMNEAISELNYKNNVEKIDNPNSLMSLLASTSINYYVNSDINKNEAKDQGDKKTCYANSIAATIYLDSPRFIYGRELDFNTIKNRMINKYGYNGSHIYKILDENLSDYKLKYRPLYDDEKEARLAIMKTRPCLAVFQLSGKQYYNFKKFFEENPKGILTKDIINKQNDYNGEGITHSVVLTHISKNYLKFLNSWGKNWGDNGYFKVENQSVLNAEFIEIYWDFNDLSQQEKDNYNNYMKKLKNDADNYLFK